MKKREWDLLFSKYDLRATLENQLKSIRDRVLKIDGRRFDAESDEFLAAEIASELVVNPLELDEEQISVSSRDVKVDVSRDFDRAIIDRGRPTYIDGIEVTYHVPCRGDKELLFCQPNTFTLNPPRAVIAKGELRFPYDQAGREIASTKKQFETDLRELKAWIPRVNEQVDAYNASVEEAVRQQIARRRAELDRTKEDLGSLGYKVRDQTSRSTERLTPEQALKKRAATRKKTERSYDVALSFAGEDREYVEEVATELKNLGISVFYDRFEEVELWGKDLAEHLGQVYSSDSRFVVLFVSRSYAAKAWPRHEKQFALAHQIASGKERVLPVRFDDTQIPGLPPTIAYLDLRALTPKKLAELIRQKIDSSSA